METMIKKQNLLIGLFAFIGLPMLLWVLGDYPIRTVLKTSLSLLTLLALFMMFAQFFLSHANSSLNKMYHAKDILKWHKAMGYIFIMVFVFHPFLIVLPRFFEAGLLPMDAFIKLITTFETTGQIVGLVAYILMFVLGATSIFRNQLHIKYNTWKLLHGVLSLLFIAFATWHAVDMGRHADKAMSIWMILLTLGSSILLLQTYITNKSEKKEHYESK